MYEVVVARLVCETFRDGLFTGANTPSKRCDGVRFLKKGRYVARARTKHEEPGIAVKFLCYCKRVLISELFHIGDRLSRSERAVR